MHSGGKLQDGWRLQLVVVSKLSDDLVKGSLANVAVFVEKWADVIGQCWGRSIASVRLFYAVTSNSHDRRVAIQMKRDNSNMAQQIAEAACAFEKQRTGHAPQSVTVVVSENTLVITLHGTLSPAERALAKSPAGAAQVQEFHRQMFANASDSLRQDIKRITGIEVREATAEVETTTGSVVGVFTTGTTVQVYLLTHPMSTEAWSGNGKDNLTAMNTEIRPC